MPKKNRVFYQTYPARPATGDEDISYHDVSDGRIELPPRLRTPFAPDVRAYYRTLTDAPNDAAREQAAIDFAAKLKRELHERWQLALQHYGDEKDSSEYWRNLALSVLQKLLPGLSVEFVYFEAPTPKRITDHHVKAVVEHVETAFALLKAGRSNKSTKVVLRQALRQAYGDWPGHLGRKPRTFKAWEEYNRRCKDRYLELTRRYGLPQSSP